MWLAALAGRLAYFTHRAGGHAVTWTTSSQDSTCPGDIVCHECGQVLWCRAHDPWRGASVEAVPDHWGGTHATQPRRTLFDILQHVLRLAEDCPSGPEGDALRRAACELIEADSPPRRSACRRRMLKSVVRLQWRSRGGARTGDPSPLTLGQLADALRRELWPG